MVLAGRLGELSNARPSLDHTILLAPVEPALEELPQLSETERSPSLRGVEDDVAGNTVLHQELWR